MKPQIFGKQFWLETLERCIKTAAQFALWAWGIGDQMLNMFDTNLLIVGQMALSGFLFSLLTSLISAPFSTRNSPSLV